MPNQPSRHPSDYLRVLYRRRWTIGLTLLMVISYGVSASVRQAPVYEAGVRLLVERADAGSSNATSAGTAGQTFFDTQAGLIQSRTLAWTTLSALGLAGMPPPAERPVAPAQASAGFVERVALFLGAPQPVQAGDERAWRSIATDRFLAGVRVLPVASSHLIDLRYRSTDAAFAARAANALGDTFVAERAAAGAGPIQIVDRAEVPLVPVLPNHTRDFVLTLLLAGVLAIGLAFGLEFLDSRLKVPDDIKTHLGIPFLGLVPSVKKRHHTGVSPVLMNEVPAGFAEALRTLRTAVVFSSAADRGRTVLVTSTAPEEGKTLVSTNLACALAQAGQRTLLIDGDMRRARVHEVFGFAQQPGLSDVVSGSSHVQTAIRKTDHESLAVLPAGVLPSNPAELLSSTKYKSVLEYLTQQFDWIIIDAPPVMAVTDAAIMSHDAGGVLFVVGAEMTPRRNAQTALEQLTLARAHVIGAVLNRVKLDRHGYYYAPYHRKDYTRAYVR